MFKKKNKEIKNSYLVSIEYQVADEFYNSNMVCVTDKEHLELSGVIKSLVDKGVKNWKVTSAIHIDNEDAEVLSDLLDIESSKSNKSESK